MVVVAIASIIIFFGMDSYSTHLKRIRDDRRRSDLNKIANALELYRADRFGEYPPPDSTHVTSRGNCADPVSSCTATDWQGNLVTLLENGRYIDDLPADPLNSPQHFYEYEPICNNFAQEFIPVPYTIDCRPDKGCCGYKLYVMGRGEANQTDEIQVLSVQ